MSSLGHYHGRHNSPFRFFEDFGNFGNFGDFNFGHELTVPNWSKHGKWLDKASHSSRFMKTDIQETDEGYAVLVEVPGVPKSAIDVSVNEEDRTVTIRVEQSEEKTESEEDGDGEEGTKESNEKGNGEKPSKKQKIKHLHRERYQGSYSRTFTMPSSCDLNSASAKVEHGILYLKFNKSENSQKKIAIE